MELQQLLKECKHNSITAQKYLYDMVAMQMFIVCRRYMKTDETAEEAMMNGFLKVFQQIVEFEYRDDASTTAWIKKVMVNECLQILRKKNSFLLVGEQDGYEVAIDEEAINNLSANEIFHLITQLPEGYKTVFNLYVMEEMSHREIAALLNISENTSKSQLRKAKQVLQQILIKNNADYASRQAK